ncbi:MAG: trigger factor [Pseudomonadales bacterium]|jgi:trigger factor|nr:trigger factor [Pseudomonadales bacterium]MDP6473132.1 trigger factor [Pseudomonadales bacterium]MDP6826111.1 trigger factor [Pseudomonadales bacterium]MDP6971513.1 trigger factor [Pseudomonadales bacterium]
MQVSVETTSGLERRLTIVVPSEEFETQITTRLTDARGKVHLPGFRPGKVPLKEVRRRFGRSVRVEVASELMESSFANAVQQEELMPAGQPSLEVLKMDPGIDLEFTATFEVFPSVALGDLGQVEVVRPEGEITDKDLKEMIARLREQRKTHEEVERAAKQGDQVTVDFQGRLEGELFEAGTGEDVEFSVGQGQMIEDFDEGVMGLSAGESREIDATFPDDYQAENLAGKTVQFALTVKKVAEELLPELDDAFFAQHGVEEGGLPAFKDDVRQNMQREMEAAANNQVKQQVMDQLHKLHSLQLPHALVHREIHALKDQMLQQMQMYGSAQAPEMPDDLFQEQAQRRVSVGLVVNEIIKSAELEADDEKVRGRLEEMAQSYPDPQQVIEWYYGNPEQLESVQMAVLEEQVVEHVLEAATVDVLKSSYTDIVSGKTLPEAEEEAVEADQNSGEADAVDDDEKAVQVDVPADDDSE